MWLSKIKHKITVSSYFYAVQPIVITTPTKFSHGSLKTHAWNTNFIIIQALYPVKVNTYCTNGVKVVVAK